MNNSKEKKQQRDGLPRWIKRTAAIVGILATATAIFTGVYQVSLQWRRSALDIEKERTKQQQAVKGAEEARLHLKNAELEIEKEKTKQKQTEKEKTQIELQQQEAVEINNEKKQHQAQDRLKEKEILKAISDVADKKKEPAFSALVSLSPYINDREYKEQILSALLLKAMNSDSTTEIEYIFKLLNNMMYDRWAFFLFSEIVQLNREAFSQFKESLLRLFWHSTKEFLDLYEEMSRTELARLEPSAISYIIIDTNPAIRSISERIRLIHPKFQGLILGEACHEFLTSVEKKGPFYLESRYKNFGMQDTKDVVYQRLVIDALIVDKTKRLIGNYLENRWIHDHDYIDHDYIDFSRTYLSGIKITSDLKNLTLKFDGAIVFDASGNDPFSVFPVLGEDRNYFKALGEISEYLKGWALDELAFNPEARNDFLKGAIDQINRELGETVKAILAGDQLNLKSRISLYLEWKLYQARLEKLEKDL